MARCGIKTKGHVPAGRDRGSCRIEGRYFGLDSLLPQWQTSEGLLPTPWRAEEIGTPTAGIFSTPKLICQYLCTMYSNFFFSNSNYRGLNVGPQKNASKSETSQSQCEFMCKNNATSNGPARKKLACQSLLSINSK